MQCKTEQLSATRRRHIHLVDRESVWTGRLLENCQWTGRLPVKLYQNVSPALTASLASLHLLPVEFYKNVHSAMIFFDSQREEYLSREVWV